MSISASQRARLGAFMVIGSALIAVFIAIPVGFKLSQRQKDYHAYWQGESVSGLEIGATVKFRGVPIGKVSDISYNPEDLSRVRVEMRVRHDFPMKTDMVAEMGGMSITGIKHIEITGGANESPLLEPGSELTTKVSPMARITGEAEEIVGKIELLIDHLTTLTHPDSAVGTILTNVADITTEAREFVRDIRPRIEGSAGSFEQIVSRIDSISADVRVILTQTRKSFSGDRFTSIMSSVDSSALAIKDVSEDVSMIIRQSREDIMVSMENLREAIENANELTKILAENPSLLLRGGQQKERDLR